MVEHEILDRREGVIVLQVRGELAGRFWTEVLGEALEEHYANDQVKLILLDLSPVSFMDNYGVATLVALHRRSLQRGKRLLVQNPEGQVGEKLKVTGVLRVLQQGA